MRNIHIIIFLSILLQINYVIGFDSTSIEPELLCLVASSHYEKKYNIPHNLLRSISIAESGKWNKEHKMSFAWPWVIGIDGKDKFFNTYSEAVVFLKRAVAVGENVDIGCHQINWKAHGQHFNKPEELLHPKINAAYAAHFLVEKYNQAKSWSKAVAHYHSHTPEFGDRYFKKVYSIFETMKGPVGQKYAVFIQNKTQSIKANLPNIPIRKHTDIMLNKNEKNLVKVKHIPNQKIQKNAISYNNIVVFSKNVELPANSVILD